MGRTLAISCAVVLGIIFFCFTALAVIGFIAGDDTGTAFRPEMIVEFVQKSGEWT